MSTARDTFVPRSAAPASAASAMDEQIIPCFATKPSAHPSAAAVAPAPAPGKAPSVTFGLAAFDPAVVPNAFVAVAAMAPHAAAMLQPAAFAMPVQIPVPVPLPMPHAVAQQQQHQQQHVVLQKNQHHQHHHPQDLHLAGQSQGLRFGEAAGNNNGCSPVAPPPAQKPRWETPLRTGTWPEAWQSAIDLATDAPTTPQQLAAVSRTVRATVAEAVVSIVGEHLPRPTVEKWLCLLSEYLELNADEQILVLCLLRRYVECDGQFVGQADHLRPQKWEKVIAVACYLSVLLSEEFPGRTATDLRELLGPNFRFGAEQIVFLKQVDWRISISHEYFVETKVAVVANDHALLMGWFKRAQDAMLRKKLAERAAAQAKASLAAIAAKAKHSDVQTPVLGKKRAAEEVSSPEDGVVPGARRTRESRHIPLPTWAI
jgi:hypothetical protein